MAVELTRKQQHELQSCLQVNPCRIISHEQIKAEAEFHYKKGLEEMDNFWPGVALYSFDDKGKVFRQGAVPSGNSIKKYISR